MTLTCCLSPQLSPYPVILSLENHCGLEQQAVMARHLRTILGDMLVTQALDSQNPEELPSPEVMLPEPQLRWGRVCLLSSFTPTHATSLVQDPSPLSAFPFPCCSSLHLPSATTSSCGLRSVPSILARGGPASFPPKPQSISSAPQDMYPALAP